jgi:hypothetical protein
LIRTLLDEYEMKSDLFGLMQQEAPESTINGGAADSLSELKTDSTAPRSPIMLGGLRVFLHLFKSTLTDSCADCARVGRSGFRCMTTLSIFADSIHFIPSTAGFMSETNSVMRESSVKGGVGLADTACLPNNPRNGNWSLSSMREATRS